MFLITPPRPRPPVLVLGLGNSLLRDEGIGAHVISAMADDDVPASVELADGGTAGLDLAALIAGRELVIVVDALIGPWDPGTVVRLERDDLLPSQGADISAHGPGLPEALRLAEFVGDPPREVVVFGVVPADTGWGEDLTPDIRRQVPGILTLVHAELERAAA